jgi:hypothetical protein
MWKILILVCATSLTRGECNKETAHDVLIPPEPASSLVECGLIGQVYLAESGIQMDGFFPLITCSSGRAVPQTVG